MSREGVPKWDDLVPGDETTLEGMNDMPRVEILKPSWYLVCIMAMYILTAAWVCVALLINAPLLSWVPAGLPTHIPVPSQIPGEERHSIPSVLRAFDLTYITFNSTMFVASSITRNQVRRGSPPVL
jgi:hypothetical protein